MRDDADYGIGSGYLSAVSEDGQLELESPEARLKEEETEETSESETDWHVKFHQHHYAFMSQKNEALERLPSNLELE